MQLFVIILLSLLAVFCLAGVFAGWYMYRFAIVRNPKLQRDAWREDPKSFADLTEADFEKIVRDVHYLREFPREQITLESHDGLKLAGHLFPPENQAPEDQAPERQPRGIVIMVHGYRSSAPFDFSGAVQDFHAMGLSCLLVDHRAHGYSEGRLIGFGATERYDVVRWAEYCRNRWPELPVVMDGISMGAATVMMGCSVGYPDNVRAIIADCGYTTPGAICRRTLKRWFKLPPFPVYHAAKIYVKLIAGYDLDGISTVDSLGKMRREKPIPILFAHGKKDDFVPCSMSEENFAVFENDGLAELFLVDEADHGLAYLRDKPGYLKALNRLFEKAGI